MVIKEYLELTNELLEEALKVSREKGKDYTVGSEDVLKNFKAVAERTGLDPQQVLAIYMMKHQDAIANYIRSGGQSESEPIKYRIIDNINYLLLLWGLINDKNENKFTKSQGKKTSKYSNWNIDGEVLNITKGGYKNCGDGRER